MPVSRHNRLIITGMTGLMVAIGIGRFAFAPILPMMVGDGLVTVADGGWLASSNYAGYFFGALVGIFFAWQGAISLRVGLIVISLVTILMAFTTSFWIWSVLRFLAGFASAISFIGISVSCTGTVAAGKGNLSNGWLFGGVGAGIVLAGLLCLGLMWIGAAACHAWMLIGVMALIGSCAVIVSLDGRTHDDLPPAEKPNSAGAEYRPLQMIVCYGIFGFAYIVPATFLPAMARELLDDTWLFGWTWPTFGVAAFISTIWVAGRSSAISNRNLWASGGLVMAAGIALPIWSVSPAALIASGLLVGGTFMVITMAGIQEARQSAGVGAPRLIGFMTAAFAIGQILGPMAISLFLMLGAGFIPGLSLATALLLVSAAMIRKRESRPEIAV